MNRWSALAALLTVACAVALRAPRLDTRPFHNDEAVNAVKVSELWQQGRYAYDPDEYHGPTLHYATLPALWLSGAKSPGQLTDESLRVAPVVFGVALILLLWLFGDGLGRHAVMWAGVFTATSPAMVFYSRYFIHEMLLVFFTVLAIGAGWQYAQKRMIGWIVAAGAGVGLMFATKETFVLTLAAIGIGIVVLGWSATRQFKASSRPRPPVVRFPWTMPVLCRVAPEWQIPCLHLVSFLSAIGIVWLLFFSSFFTNFSGLLDSFRTYLPWLKRAGGESPHIHPWSFYFERLTWFHLPKSPAWSEGLIVFLALIGAVVAVSKSALHRFLAMYTLVLASIYAIISYKTPWCMLNFYIGMILMAGVGAAWLIELPRRAGAPFLSARVVVATVIAAFTAQLSWQAWRASIDYASDRGTPYVYAQTVPGLLKLVERVEGIAAVAPSGFGTVVKVIAPESDYWPLPWYFRRFQQIGWYDKLPAEPYSPIVIVSSKLDARLDERSGKKWIMAGISELRPETFLELYVELELWKKFVARLPPPNDDE